MTLQTLLSNTDINGFSFAEETIIIAALTNLYNGSATARTMLDKVTAQKPLTINFLSDSFQAHGYGAHLLELDLNYQDKFFFITPTGKAIKYPLSVNLAHELEHAINSTDDDPKTDINLAGPTVIATNVIHDEMGVAHRLTYDGAADITNTSVQIDKEYTNGATIDVAIVMQTAEGVVNYDVVTANHTTNSRDLLIGNDSDNELLSYDGNDFLYGNGGDDLLKGGGDSDFLDGGDGVDTAYYGAFVPMTLNVRASSANSSNPNTIELDRSGSDVDYIKSIEKVMLGFDADTVIITRNPNIPYSNNVMFDGGEGIDTLQYADERVVTSIRELSAASEQASSGISMDLIGNIEKIKGTAGDDKLNIGLLTNTKVETIESGAGEDTVWVFGSAIGAKPVIDLGANDDILKHAPQGAIVYGGTGNDTFNIGKDFLIADAEEDDVITNGTQVLHGGVTWRGQESPWAKGLGGIKYAQNDVGELVIEDRAGNQTFVANFNFSLSGPRTAGILIGEMSLDAYRLFNTPNGAKIYESFEAVFGGYFKAMFGYSQFPGIDPLMLDLDGDGLELNARLGISPYYDIDGDGFGEKSGWLRIIPVLDTGPRADCKAANDNYIDSIFAHVKVA